MALADRFRLDGRAALVTGASRGLGAGMARALAEAGAHVVLHSSREEARAAADVIAAECGVRTACVTADLSEPASTGKIINIASLLSFQGGIRASAHAAAKGAAAQLTKALANEWASGGVNVNAIAPGYMVTDNTRSLIEDPVRYRDITARIPAGRWGQPDNLAGATVFLASAASDYVHGHVLVVDGGWMGR